MATVDLMCLNWFEVARHRVPIIIIVWTPDLLDNLITDIVVLGDYIRTPAHTTMYPSQYMQ